MAFSVRDDFEIKLASCVTDDTYLPAFRVLFDFFLLVEIATNKILFYLFACTRLHCEVQKGGGR